MQDDVDREPVTNLADNAPNYSAPHRFPFMSLGLVQQLCRLD